jgi:hypothetical protein
MKERRKVVNTCDTLGQVLGVTRLSRFPCTRHAKPYATCLMPYVWRGLQAFTRHVRARV